MTATNISVCSERAYLYYFFLPPLPISLPRHAVAPVFFSVTDVPLMSFKGNVFYMDLTLRRI